jgi:hypothetical protein
MEPVLLLTLAGLALVDSTSFGTLVIPLWLMTSPHGLRPGRILAFLGVVATFYLGVGVVLLVGGASLVDALGDTVGDSPVVLWAQLVIGVALFASSFYVRRKPRERAGDADADAAEPPRPGRVARWRDRAAGGEGSLRGVVTLALVAATLEVATMLPYLGAIGLLAGSDSSTGLRVAVLAAYCVVMVVPALALLALRVGLRRRIEPLLARLSRWLERTGAEATSWVLGIAGFLVARDAVGRLFF